MHSRPKRCCALQIGRSGDSIIFCFIQTRNNYKTLGCQARGHGQWFVAANLGVCLLPWLDWGNATLCPQQWQSCDGNQQMHSAIPSVRTSITTEFPRCTSWETWCRFHLSKPKPGHPTGGARRACAWPGGAVDAAGRAAMRGGARRAGAWQGWAGVGRNLAPRTTFVSGYASHEKGVWGQLGDGTLVARRPAPTRPWYVRVLDPANHILFFQNLTNPIPRHTTGGSGQGGTRQGSKAGRG